ncbi:MAG: RidA family protein [Promethearchaeota archaeon]
MSLKKEVIDAGTGKGGAYSPGLKIGNLIFISGQIPNRNPETGEWLSSDIEGQTIEALEKIKKLIEKCGGTLNNIAKTTVFLANPEDFSRFNKAYEKYFKDNGVSDLPARSTVGVRFPLDGMLIEIDCFAVL